MNTGILYSLSAGDIHNSVLHPLLEAMVLGCIRLKGPRKALFRQKHKEIKEISKQCGSCAAAELYNSSLNGFSVFSSLQRR